MTDELDSIPWPAKDADERAMLTGFLDGYRAVLVRKATGLRPDQLRQTLAPSDLTLGGLLKHMAVVEDEWFEHRFAGREMPEPWASADWEADIDWEMTSSVNDSPQELFALLDTACRRSQAVMDAAASLDDLSATADDEGQHWSLRWILVHMIEEYARHVGHADFLRQSIDGSTGD